MKNEEPRTENQDCGSRRPIFSCPIHSFLKSLASAGVIQTMGPDDLGRLMDEHAAALALYARQWCAAADDVVQEAFVKLARLGLAPDPVLPWLYRVVRNAAISAGRSEQRRRKHEANAAAANPGWFVPNEGEGLDAASAANALQGLAVEQREAIVARLWGGLTFEQIGSLIGVSAASAYRLYQAGVQALRERLGVSCPTRAPNPS